MIYQSNIASQGWDEGRHHISFLHVMFCLHPGRLSLGNSLIEAPDMFAVSRVESSLSDLLVWAQATESSVELVVIRLSTFPLISSDLHLASLLRFIMASLFCCQDCGELLLEMSYSHKRARGCSRLTTRLHLLSQCWDAEISWWREYSDQRSNHRYPVLWSSHRYSA